MLGPTHTVVLGLLLTLAVVPAHAIGDTPETEAAADRLRSMYFARDYEGGYREGLRLREEFVGSRRLQAWHLLHAVRWRHQVVQIQCFTGLNKTLNL